MVNQDISRRTAIVLMVIVLFGMAFISLYDIAHTPPGVASDAMDDVGDGFRISRGLPFPADFTDRPETPYRYLLAAWFVFAGPDILVAIMCQVTIALITVALTYRAGMMLLAGQAWRRLGAVIAAGTMAAIPPYLFIVRSPYRAILVPLVILLAAINLLSAHRARPQRWRRWILAGFIASWGMQTYLAGVMVPVWAIAVLVHQMIFPRQRLRFRYFIAALVGVLPIALMVLAFLKFLPTMYARLDQVRGGTTITPQFILAGIDGSIRAYFSDGHPLPTFNAPHAPFVNPILGVLAVLGIGWAIWRWRRIEGAMLLGGLIIFSLPGVITNDPTYPQRRVGVMPTIALLAGCGAAVLVAAIFAALDWALKAARSAHWLSRLRQAARPALVTVTTGLMIVSLANTHVTYQGVFSDPSRYSDPRNWTSIPHNYSVAFEEAMNLLAKVDQPTYVPMWLLDNEKAMFFLQRRAFPNVTTWARYGLKELPAGQFFMPGYWYYHMEANDTSIARVLLLPQEKTMVLLPGYGLSDAIAGPPPKHGDTGVTEITSDRGWVIARTRPVSRADFNAPAKLQPGELAPTFGNGLQLLARRVVGSVEPGQQVTVYLEWLVTAPQRSDVFSVAQLLNQNDIPLAGGSDQHIMFYLYPSALWKPGDIIPDWHVVTIPTDVPPGNYRWAAGAYVPPDRQRLPVTPPPGVDSGPQLPDLWLFGGVRIPTPKITAQPLPSSATKIDARLGSHIALEGYQLAPQGQSLVVTLYWRAADRDPGDYTIFVHAQQGDKLIAQDDEKPLGGNSPTWAWQPGELVTTTFTLAIPPGSPPDSLYVGMYSYPSLQRLSVVQDGAARNDNQIKLSIGEVF